MNDVVGDEAAEHGAAGGAEGDQHEQPLALVGTVDVVRKGPELGRDHQVEDAHPEEERNTDLDACADQQVEPDETAGELAELEYDISVLSPFRRVQTPRQIKVGLHGLLVEKGRIQGLLLPQVAEERNWDRETFLEQTCLKAGLEPDAWKEEETDVYVFSATVFGESHSD